MQLLCRTSAGYCAANGFIYMFGGFLFSSVSTTILPDNHLYRFDPSLLIWTNLGANLPGQPYARIKAGLAAALGDLYIFGGQGSGVSEYKIKLSTLLENRRNESHQQLHMVIGKSSSALIFSCQSRCLECGTQSHTSKPIQPATVPLTTNRLTNSFSRQTLALTLAYSTIFIASIK